MKSEKSYRSSHTSNAVYGLGFIGAAVYYIQIASGFWSVVTGLIKALLWPAFMVYEIFRYIEL